MSEKVLLAPTFLFRFAVPCRKIKDLWSDKQLELPEAYRIPTFGELEGRPVFADFRMGWHPDGIALSLSIFGKKQAPWCRVSRFEDSDGVALWIDTRYTGDVHRATRFCHQFMIMPQGGGPNRDGPEGRLLDIARARENPPKVDPETIRVRAENRIDGYLLRAAIPASALNGYDPTDQASLGFTYAVMDREFGWQTFTISPEFGFMSDPTLWGQLDLVKT